MQPLFFEAGFFGLLGISLGGLVAWQWTSLAARKNFSGRFQIVETRMKAAENRVGVLKDQLESARAETLLAQEGTNRDRQSWALETAGMKLSFQHQALRFGTYALAAGMLFGGAMAWTVSGSRAEVKHLQRVMQIEVESRTALAELTRAQTRLEQTQGENKKLRDSLFAEMEQKALLYAKLEVLLQGLSGEKWGRDFILNQKKLIEDWNLRIRGDQTGESTRLGSLLALSK